MKSFLISGEKKSAADEAVDKYIRQRQKEFDDHLKRKEMEFDEELRKSRMEMFKKLLQEDVNYEVLRIIAMCLMAQQEVTDCTPEQLVETFKRIFTRRAEELQFYESNGAEGVDGDAAIRDLRNMDVDIVELNKKYGEELIQLNFTQVIER